jgi:hypothetical protein
MPCRGCQRTTHNRKRWCDECLGAGLDRLAKLEGEGSSDPRFQDRDNLRAKGDVFFIVEQSGSDYLALRCEVVHPSDRGRDVIALLCQGTEQQCDAAVRKAIRRAA